MYSLYIIVFSLLHGRQKIYWFCGFQCSAGSEYCVVSSGLAVLAVSCCFCSWFCWLSRFYWLVFKCNYHVSLLHWKFITPKFCWFHWLWRLLLLPLVQLVWMVSVWLWWICCFFQFWISLFSPVAWETKWYLSKLMFHTKVMFVSNISLLHIYSGLSFQLHCISLLV